VRGKYRLECSLWVRCVAVLLMLLFASAARAQSDDAKKKAQALQVEGVRLLQKGDNAGALAKFNDAFALVQSPKIMFNMGKAYRGLGNDVEALRAFDTFLDEAPYAPKASRADAEREVQALRPKLSYIEVETEDSGSTVRIDGRDMGKAPLVRPVVVAPGMHEVKLEKAGMLTETRSVAPIAGQKLRVLVKLSPVPPPQSEKPPVVADSATPKRRTADNDESAPAETPPRRIADNPPVGPAPPGRPWQLNAAWVSAGIGVLALGGGITAQVLWSRKNQEFNDVPQMQCNRTRPNLGGGVCPSLDSQAKFRLALAIAGYATAGAAAIATLIFVLTAPDASSDAHAPAGNTVSLGCLPAASSGLSCALTTRF
jgi:hypothetical protein